jgi:apolipoprotein N-acyltransferase
VSTSQPSARKGALALYASLTLFSFPHELPGGFVLDLGYALAWFGPAALIVGIDGLSPGRAARAAFLASLAGHFVLFHWFFVVTVQYGGMSGWLGVLSPLVPSLYVSSFSALFAWSWARFGRLSGSPILVGAMSWVAVDWLRGHFMGGFPWATLGYALHLDAPLLAWTRWAGVYVLSFFVVAVGVAIGRVWLDRQATTIRSLAVSIAVVAVAHGLGSWMAHDEFDSAASVRIAAVQGNIDQRQKWDSARRNQILDTYLRLSTEAADAGAQWIVWPESAVPGLIDVDPPLRDQLGRLARSHDASLIVGGTGVEFDSVSGRYTAFYDSAFVIDSAGNVRDRYDKIQLVPFGEFVPLRALLGQVFKALATGISPMDITAGSAPRTMMIDGGEARDVPLSVGVPICYELIFPHVVRQFGVRGAGVMLAVTNDAWYGRTGAPHQFLAMTAMRAAENGRWMVRAANSGVSAIIDARGRVREASALFEEAVIVADVPVATRAPSTFYARFGDIFAGLCVVGSVGLFGRKKLEERSRRADLRRDREA